MVCRSIHDMKQQRRRWRLYKWYTRRWKRLSCDEMHINLETTFTSHETILIKSNQKLLLSWICRNTTSVLLNMLIRTNQMQVYCWTDYNQWIKAFETSTWQTTRFSQMKALTQVSNIIRLFREKKYLSMNIYQTQVDLEKGDPDSSISCCNMIVFLLNRTNIYNFSSNIEDPFRQSPANLYFSSDLIFKLTISSSNNLMKNLVLKNK